MTGNRILALSGGVGGAKLAAGLAAVMPPEDLRLVVNTGDDFEHLGLTICPDIDSVVYALAGLNDQQRGWGVADESWQAMAMLKRLGEEGWFNLGDRDLAMHIARSRRLRAGRTLSDVTQELARALDIRSDVIPMSDEPVRTQVLTEHGWTDFQRWFVGEQCNPAVTDIRFAADGSAAPSPAFEAALANGDLRAIVICPSNPFLSIDPILSLKGVREALARRRVPVVAVSPLIGGNAVKGPLAKLLGEMGQEISNVAIADHYGDLVDHFLIDISDEGDAPELMARGLNVTATDIMMRDAADRQRLARKVLALTGD